MQKLGQAHQLLSSQTGSNVMASRLPLSETVPLFLWLRRVFFAFWRRMWQIQHFWSNDGVMLRVLNAILSKMASYTSHSEGHLIHHAKVTISKNLIQCKTFENSKAVNIEKIINVNMLLKKLLFSGLAFE